MSTHEEQTAKSSPQAKERILSRRDRIVFHMLLAMTLGVVMLLIGHRLEQLSYENYVRDLKLDTTLRLIEVRERIEEDIYERATALNEFAAFVAANPDLNETQFNIRALDFVLENEGIINLAAAPNLKVSMVFPKLGNEKVIGLDYRDLPAQLPAIERAIGGGEGIITGPVNLVQGGRGIIMRKPIFVSEASGSTRFWGILSVVMDYNAMVEGLGLPAIEEQFDLLVREAADSSLVRSAVLFGDPGLSAKDPIVMDIRFPFGKWQLAATYDGGWPQYVPGYANRWLQRLILIAAVLIASFYVMRLAYSRRIAERQLSIGIEALEHGFVMFDPDRRLVAFNKRYKQLAGGSGMVRLGARYEDIVKANLRKGLIPDAVGREEEWYDNWSKRLTLKSSDNEQVLADGRLIRAYDRPMEDGSVVGLRIDVTDLRRAQMQAEAANKAKTDFMGVLSHELRTPLTVILGHAKLAKNFRNMPAYRKMAETLEAHPEVRDELQPQLDKLHNQIGTMMNSLEKSGDHLFFLISEILDFAKIDSGTLSMDMSPIESGDIVRPVIDQMRPMIEDKGIKLEVSDQGCPITGNTKRLQQVLINLISNAAKFTDEGKISVKVVKGADTVVFHVADTGIGIPEDQLTKVFDAFHQVDNSSGRKFGGTGLGLAISRDIAHAHHGDLTAASTEGKGSTFTLTLPLRENDAASQAEEDDEAGDHQMVA
ncbi:MAG: ATP-binding protein [Sulfitobacter sp.]|nr:ATP-binding protein [Sulfitobacter sp.]